MSEKGIGCLVPARTLSETPDRPVELTTGGAKVQLTCLDRLGIAVVETSNGDSVIFAQLV